MIKRLEMMHILVITTELCQWDYHFTLEGSCHLSIGKLVKTIHLNDILLNQFNIIKIKIKSLANHV